MSSQEIIEKLPSIRINGHHIVEAKFQYDHSLTIFVKLEDDTYWLYRHIVSDVVKEYEQLTDNSLLSWHSWFKENPPAGIWVRNPEKKLTIADRIKLIMSEQQKSDE